MIADIHKESGGIFHHMGIGQNQPLFRDEYAAAKREGMGFLVDTHDEDGGGLGLAIEVALGQRKRHIRSGRQKEKGHHQRR